MGVDGGMAQVVSNDGDEGDDLSGEGGTEMRTGWAPAGAQLVSVDGAMPSELLGDLDRVAAEYWYPGQYWH